MSRSNSLLRDLLKAARWHRRLLAGVSAAAAVYFGLVALSPSPPPTVTVLAAAHDLPGGAVPGTADLRTLRLPPDVVPVGALRPGDDSARRVLAAPVRSGETLTDARFLSPDLLSTGPAGLVAYPLRIEDADIAGLLRVGDRIDLYAATSSAADSAGRVAQAVRVLALPGGRASPSAAGSAGALVVIAASSEVIGQIAQSAANSRITIALTPDRGG
jgi:Flp pilus assembly protein CpaB